MRMFGGFIVVVLDVYALFSGLYLHKSFSAHLRCSML